MVRELQTNAHVEEPIKLSVTQDANQPVISPESIADRVLQPANKMTVEGARQARDNARRLQEAAEAGEVMQSSVSVTGKESPEDLHTMIESDVARRSGVSDEEAKEFLQSINADRLVSTAPSGDKKHITDGQYFYQIPASVIANLKGFAERSRLAKMTPEEKQALASGIAEHRPLTDDERKAYGVESDLLTTATASMTKTVSEGLSGVGRMMQEDPTSPLTPFIGKHLQQAGDEGQQIAQFESNLKKPEGVAGALADAGGAMAPEMAATLILPETRLAHALYWMALGGTKSLGRGESIEQAALHAAENGAMLFANAPLSPLMKGVEETLLENGVKSVGRPLFAGLFGYAQARVQGAAHNDALAQGLMFAGMEMAGGKHQVDQPLSIRDHEGHTQHSISVPTGPITRDSPVQTPALPAGSETPRSIAHIPLMEKVSREQIRDEVDGFLDGQLNAARGLNSLNRPEGSRTPQDAGSDPSKTETSSGAAAAPSNADSAGLPSAPPTDAPGVFQPTAGRSGAQATRVMSQSSIASPQVESGNPSGISPPAAKPTKDYSFLDRFRSRLSNLDDQGVYERKGGQLGKEASELMREAQILIEKGEIPRHQGLRIQRARIEEIADALDERGQPGLSEAMLRHLDRIEGKPSEFELRIGDAIRAVPGLSSAIKDPDRAFRNTLGTIRSVNHALRVRWNVKSILVNELQPLMTLWPYLKTSDFARAVVAARRPSYRKHLAEIGVFDAGSKVEGVNNRASSGVKGWITNPFAKASETNRAVGYAAGEITGRKLGLTGDDLHRHAMDFAKRTEFDNSAWDVPDILSSPAGATIGQYKGFTMKNLEATGRLLKWRAGDTPTSWARRAAKFGVAVGLQGGIKATGATLALNLAGVSVYQLIQGLTGQITRTGVKRDDAEKMAQVMVFGAPAAGGFDISASVALLDEPFGNTRLEKAVNLLGGTNFSAALELVQSGKQLIDAQTPEERKQVIKRAATRLTPYVKTYDMARQMIENQGRGAEVEMGRAKLRLTPKEAVGRGLGFTPLKQTLRLQPRKP